MNSYSAFSYKSGNSIFHRMPSWLKILLIPALNILVFSFNFKVAVGCSVVLFILMFFLKFSIREQLTDLTPVIWYGFFIYIVEFISKLYLNYGTMEFAGWIKLSFYSAFLDIPTFSTVIKFLACNQSASLMFKTSTSLELREGIEAIELFIRRLLPVKKECSFSIVISMFICFIPTVFKMWNQLKRAWIARNGKYSLKMFLVLFPCLFSLGLKYSFDSAKALMNRLR